MMMPHSNNLMLSSPLNPTFKKFKGVSKGYPVPIREQFPKVSFAKTGKPRFFLNSSKLDSDGL